MRRQPEAVPRVDLGRVDAGPRTSRSRTPAARDRDRPRSAKPARTRPTGAGAVARPVPPRRAPGPGAGAPRRAAAQSGQRRSAGSCETPGEAQQSTGEIALRRHQSSKRRHFCPRPSTGHLRRRQTRGSTPSRAMRGRATRISRAYAPSSRCRGGAIARTWRPVEGESRLGSGQSRTSRRPQREVEAEESAFRGGRRSAVSPRGARPRAAARLRRAALRSLLALRQSAARRGG